MQARPSQNFLVTFYTWVLCCFNYSTIFRLSTAYLHFQLYCGLFADDMKKLSCSRHAVTNLLIRLIFFLYFFYSRPAVSIWSWRHLNYFSIRYCLSSSTLYYQCRIKTLSLLGTKSQCCGSESAWIRIGFGRLDPNPDPEGQKMPTNKKRFKKFCFEPLRMFSFESWRLLLELGRPSMEAAG